MHVWLVAQGACEEKFAVFMKDLGVFPTEMLQVSLFFAFEFSSLHSLNLPDPLLVCFANAAVLTLEVSP